MTEPEVVLWSRLRVWREHGCSFRRQHPIGPYIADFACVGAKLVVELDGDQHGADGNRAYDQRRDAYMQARGWRVVRISNDRIYRNLGEVLNMLGDLAVPPSVRSAATSPAIPKEGRRAVLSTAGEERECSTRVELSSPAEHRSSHFTIDK
jgi:very-short-patch-repair endonuclease